MADNASVAAVLLPACGMAAVTGAVWIKLYVDRLGEMQARQIAPQKIATSRQSAALLEKTNASDNFKNLFEVPVLFYAACAMHAAARLPPSPAFVRALWAFVVLRALHSTVQVTANRVMVRFTFYATSCGVMFYIWGHLTRRLLAIA